MTSICQTCGNPVNLPSDLCSAIHEPWLYVNGKYIGFSDEDYKAGAYAYCEIRGLDPEEFVSYIHPKGFAVSCKRRRWLDTVEMLKKHIKHTNALNAAINTMEVNRAAKQA